MTSIIGFNTPGFLGTLASASAKYRALDHMRKVQPRWCLAFGVDDANVLRGNGVQNVAVRLFNGEQFVAGRLTASELMRRFQNVADNGHWCEITNEVGLQITWLKSVLPTMLVNGFKVCAPALSSGTPEPTDYAGTRGLMEIAAQYPNSFRFSVHEYSPFTPFNMLATEWKPGIPYPSGPQWYNGRFASFAYAYCDQWGLPRPRYVVTEFGVAAQNGARNAVPAANGYPSANGWWSAQGWYEKNWPGKSAAQTVAEMTTWLAGWYEQNGCDGLCWYTLGADNTRIKGSQEDWSAFDILAGNSGETFYSEFERYAMSTQPPTQPPVETADWQPRQLRTSGLVNVRSSPSLSGGVIQQVDSSKLISGYMQVMLNVNGDVTADGYTWRNIQIGGRSGFVASVFVSLIEPPAISPEVLADLQAAGQHVSAAASELAAANAILSKYS